MSGGICLWARNRFSATWKTTCGGRQVVEQPAEGRACPYCGNRVVVEE